MSPENDGPVPQPEASSPAEAHVPAASGASASTPSNGGTPHVGDAVDAEEVQEVEEFEAVEDVEEIEEVQAVNTAKPPSLPPRIATPIAGAHPLGAAESAVTTLAGEGWAERLALFEKELALEGDKERRALLEYEIGELTENAAADEGAAAKRYGKALVADPTLRANTWALKRICERRASWPTLLKVIDAEIKLARDDAERAELWVERGTILSDKMGDPAMARAALEQSVALAPTYLPALMALEKIAAREGDLATLASLCRRAADATGDRGRRVALLVDLARIEQSRVGGGDDSALAILREAHAIGLQQAGVLDEMEQLAEAGGRTEDLLATLDLRAQLLAQRTTSNNDDEGRHRIALAIAAIRRRQSQLVRTSDGERAWRYLELASEQVPDEPLLLADLAQLAEELGRHDAAASLHARRVAAAPPSVRVSLLHRQATALRLAGQVAAASAVEQEIEKLAPLDWPLLVGRQLRANAEGDLRALARRATEEAELALRGATPSNAIDTEWAAASLTAAGSILERVAGPTAGAPEEAEAIGAWRHALEARPGYRAAVDALDRRFALTGRIADRARLLDGELGSADRARSGYLLSELIELRVGEGDLEGAIGYAERLMAYAEGDGEARARVRLIELCRVAGRWKDAASHLERLGERLAASGQVERAAETRLERAAIHERRLNDPDRALALYLEAAQLHPTPHATAELKRLHTAAGRHTELAQVIEQEIAATLKAERVASLLLELGDVYERHLNRPADAARVYRDLLDRVPGHVGALRALGRAAERQGDVRSFAQSLEATAEAAGGASSANELLALGEVFEDRLGDVDQADDAFARSFARSPSAHAAYGRFRAQARRRDAARLEEAVGELAMDASPAAQTALAEERAWLIAGPGDDLDGGEKRLAAALATTPDSTSLLVASWRIAARRGDAGRLAASLHRLAERTTDGELAGALEVRAATLFAATGGDAVPSATAALVRAADDGAVLVAVSDLLDDPDVIARRRALAEAGASIEWRLELIDALEARGRHADACAEALAALGEAPSNFGVLGAVRRLALAAGDRRGYARATARLASQLKDRDRAAAAWTEAARIFDELGDAADAALCWRAVLEHRPDASEAYQHAHAALVRLDDAAAIDQLLSERIERETERARVPLWLERAKLRLKTGQPRRAMDDFRAVLDADAQNAVALEQLGQLSADDGDLESAIRLLDRYAEAAPDGEELRRTHLRLADLHHKAGDAAAAVASLQRALVYQADDLVAIERLADIHFEQKEYAESITQLRSMARLSTDKSARARLEQRIADVYLNGLKEPRGAIDALVRALDEEPLDLETLARVAPLAEAQGELQLRDGVLDRAAEAALAQVDATPRDPAPYRALERVLALRVDEDRRALAGQAAALAAGESPAPRTGVEPARELTAATWERVYPAGTRGLFLELWRETQEASVKMFSPELTALGAGKNDRQNAKGIPLAWIPVDKIARAVGAGAYELYLAPAKRELAATAGPAVVLGGAHSDKLSPTTRFRVARVMMLLRDHIAPLETIDDAELDLYFTACARVAGASWTASSRPVEAKIEDRVKALNKHLDRRAKKALSALAPRFVSLGEAREWRRAMLDGANRVALAVAGDISAALTELKLTLADAAGQALVRFALSDDMTALRRDLGLRA